MTRTLGRLRGACVLVLEDDYYQATDLQAALESVGAVVLGPFGDEADATAALTDARPDCAFIDVNLGHGPSFAVPLALTEGAVPFAFVTGYDAGTIPTRLAGVPRYEKPVDATKVIAMVERLLGRA